MAKAAQVNSEWSSWSECSKTCGGGVQSRRRLCSGGIDCSGPSSRYRQCNRQACPEDSPGAGTLTLKDDGGSGVCTIPWKKSPTLQTFNIAQVCTKGKTATTMTIEAAAQGTIISVNGLPLASQNGKATSTLMLQINDDIPIGSSVPVGNFDQDGSYGNGGVNATYYPIDGAVISKRVSTVTISV